MPKRGVSDDASFPFIEVIITKAIKSIISILLSLLIIAVPLVYRSTVNAIAISSFVVGLVIAILVACGISFVTVNYDVGSWIEDAINDYLTYMGFSSIDDWLGADYQNQVGVYDNYLKLSPTLWSPLTAFVQWLRSSERVSPGGSLDTPSQMPIQSQYYLPPLTISEYGFSGSNVPVIPESMLVQISNYNNRSFFTLPYGYSFLTLPISQLHSNVTFNITVNNVNYGHTFRIYGTGNSEYIDLTTGNMQTTYFAVGPANTQYPIIIDATQPINFFFVQSGNVAYFAFSYIGSNGLLMASRIRHVTPIPLFSNSTYAAVLDTSVTIPTMNNTDDIYIDLQQGNLIDAITALTNLLSQVNQNLINVTTALQSLPQDLPVDTSPFIQLVQSYESITNDYVNNNITLTSALSSMYTLLSNSISQITNVTLENACISAYNAFVNKLALYQATGGVYIGSFESVQDMQVDLSDLYDDYSLGSVSIDSTLSAAATLLDNYMSNATGIQEVIGLQNAYNQFLNRLGFELNLSSNASDVIDGFNDTLDDYLSGDIDRSTALSDLRTGYRNGISGSITATDVGVITSAYQAALDQIAVNEFDISTAMGEVAADTISLESDLLGEFDYYTYAELFDFEEWQLFPQQESNLYREYFQRILDDTSPFYAFVYYPLILGVAGLILGSAITFSSKGKNTRGSSYRSGRSDK